MPHLPLDDLAMSLSVENAADHRTEGDYLDLRNSGRYRAAQAITEGLIALLSLARPIQYTTSEVWTPIGPDGEDERCDHIRERDVFVSPIRLRTWRDFMYVDVWVDRSGGREACLCLLMLGCRAEIYYTSKRLYSQGTGKGPTQRHWAFGWAEPLPGPTA